MLPATDAAGARWLVEAVRREVEALELPSSNDGTPQRIAVIYMGPRVFIFTGDIKDAAKQDELDAQLLASIRTFRAIQNNERFSGNESKIRYVQVGDAFSFPALARMSARC